VAVARMAVPVRTRALGILQLHLMYLKILDGGVVGPKEKAPKISTWKIVLPVSY
jgi:hypothetical protein